MNPRLSGNTVIRGSDPNRRQSFERESDSIVFARRQVAAYHCPECGEDTTVVLHEEAAPPPLWMCPCGLKAEYMGDEDTGAEINYTPGKTSSATPRTAWDMLMERRTEAELQATLDARLELLRAGKLRLGAADRRV